MILVADTGPIIALAKVEKLELLKNLTWQTVCIPPRVHKELWAKVGPESDAIEQEYVLELSRAEKYESGLFYKRELPGILRMLEKVEQDVHTIIVDGYVWLSRAKKPGLGGHLYNALERRVNIIGVAKRPYRDVSASKV